MKIFRGRSVQILCGLCHAWIPLQHVRQIRKIAQPQRFSDGRGVEEFSRIYECPRCQGPILRSPKVKPA
jgi:hypothetical protein